MNVFIKDARPDHQSHHARDMKLRFLLIAAVMLATAARPAVHGGVLCWRGGARKKKTARLHDLKRDDDRNEYFAGGQSEEGGGSATVLLYPDEEPVNATANETANATAPIEEPKTSHFAGEGRKL